MITRTGLANNPIGAAFAVGLVLANGVGGIDILVPNTHDRAWFYVYFGISFGFSAPARAQPALVQPRRGRRYQVPTPEAYAGPFISLGGSYGRVGGVLPAGATVFTGFGRDQSYGVSIPINPSSTTLGLSAGSRTTGTLVKLPPKTCTTIFPIDSFRSH